MIRFSNFTTKIDNEEPSERRAFTIIEVVLFIALSSFLFIVIFSRINNSINKSQFTEAARDLQTKLQLTYSEVSNGISDGAVNECFLSGGDTLSFPTSADTTLGNDEDCVLLGKVITFYSDQMTTESLVGLRLDSSEFGSNSEAGLVAKSYPVLYKDPSGSRVPFVTKYRWNKKVESVTVNGTRVNASGANPVSSIAFMRSPKSGAMLAMAYVSTSRVDYSSSSNDYSENADVLYRPDIQVCMDEGGGEAAILTIGEGTDSAKIGVEVVENC